MQNIQHYAGWYPRWWLMAAFLCTVSMLIGMIAWDVLLCPGRNNGSNEALICHLADAAYIVQIGLIWLFFLCLWLLAFMFTFKVTEVPTRQQSRAGKLLRASTDFVPLHSALLIQGILSAILINVMWWVNNSPVIAFALLSISVFVAHCSLFYRSSPEQRRLYLAGYGLLSLILLLIEGLFKHHFQAHLADEWLLLCIQGLLVLIGVIAIFWRLQPAAQRTTQAPSHIEASDQLSPLTILGSLWPFNRFIPETNEQRGQKDNKQDHSLTSS